MTARGRPSVLGPNFHWILLLLLAALLPCTALAPTEAETLKEATDLVASKKYESAFRLLRGFDPRSQKPDVVLLEERIALEYFVSSIMHQMFALKDLEKSEEVEDFRGKAGKFSMFKFAINDELDSLLMAYPDNCQLHKGLADYYYEVHLKYGDQWLKNTPELLSLIETHYRKAIEGNCADYLPHYALGYAAVVQGRYVEAIPHFLESLKRNDGYASSHYNLAFAYMNTGELGKALASAKAALGLYADQTYKGDAARMVGSICADIGDTAQAVVNYELSNQIDPGNYYTLKTLLSLYLSASDSRANQVRDAFFGVAPENPTIYNDLDALYADARHDSDLVVYYKSKMVAYQRVPKVLGNLYFYAGRLYLRTDKQAAKECFLKAKRLLAKAYGKDHQVFKAVAEALDECAK